MYINMNACYNPLYFTLLTEGIRNDVTGLDWHHLDRRITEYIRHRFEIVLLFVITYQYYKAQHMNYEQIAENKISLRSLLISLWSKVWYSCSRWLVDSEGIIINYDVLRKAINGNDVSGCRIEISWIDPVARSISLSSNLQRSHIARMSSFWNTPKTGSRHGANIVLTDSTVVCRKKYLHMQFGVHSWRDGPSYPGYHMPIWVTLFKNTLKQKQTPHSYPSHPIWQLHSWWISQCAGHLDNIV